MPTVITGTDGINQVQAGAVESGDLPAGSVIQVVTKTINTLLVLSDTSYTDMPGFDITMTLNNINNKVLLFTHFGCIAGDPSNNTTALRYVRDGTEFSVGLSGQGSRIPAGSAVAGNGAHINQEHSFDADFNAVDTNPNSSVVTYNLQYRNESGNLYVNRTENFPNNSRPQDSTFVSTMIAMEIAT